MSDRLHSLNNEMMIDDGFRGFPSGHKPLTIKEIREAGWKPYDGTMALPLMSLNKQAFLSNAQAMMEFVKANGVEIAPHAKTPMSPELARKLIALGAWGATVADIRQASVLLKNGFGKLILGNQIGGKSAAKRLAKLMTAYPDAELHIFVDSVELAQILLNEWASDNKLPKLGLLVELGIARAGLRDAQSALPVIEAILAGETDNIILSGVAAYEGAAGVADPDETIKRVDHLLDEASQVYQMIQDRLKTPRPLILTAGGSLFFDRVISKWKPLQEANQNLQIILRSGAIFFHDHGVYERGIAQLDKRKGFGSKKALEVFSPALRLWGEVLSRPETQTVICGFGMRDVAFDQDLPRILNIYRDGHFLRALTDCHVVKLNDQHAFIECAANADIEIGDVIELGISHPCTCLDRHSLIYGVDENHSIISVYPTYFG